MVCANIFVYLRTQIYLNVTSAYCIQYITITKVYLRNLETTTKIVRFKCTGDTNHEITLKPLQWAFFPWTAADDIKVFASAANTRIEYGTFS